MDRVKPQQKQNIMVQPLVLSLNPSSTTGNKKKHIWSAESHVVMNKKKAATGSYIHPPCCLHVYPVVFYRTIFIVRRRQRCRLVVVI